MVVGLSAGCFNSGNNGDNGDDGASLFPMNVMDQAGRVVQINSEPKKIISLAPSNTEIVFALGLVDKLVGVTDFCNYPAAALDKPKVGGFSTADIEKVVAIQPDLILAANIHLDEVVPQLENLGFTVIVIKPKSLDEILEGITLVGKVTNKIQEAETLVTNMRNRIDVVSGAVTNLDDAEKPAVFYVIWHDPLMTVGSDTIINQLITTSGGLSISRNMVEDYPTISLEAVIVANPDVMIAGSAMGAGGDLPFIFISTDDRLAGITARINGDVSEVITDLVGRAGPRIVDGLEAIARLIHPELFS
jgi:iron complex transport system substrate-binding protein